MRSLALVTPTTRVTIARADGTGRPSLLLLDISPDGGIEIAGSTARI